MMKLVFTAVTLCFLRLRTGTAVSDPYNNNDNIDLYEKNQESTIIYDEPISGGEQEVADSGENSDGIPPDIWALILARRNYVKKMRNERRQEIEKEKEERQIKRMKIKEERKAERLARQKELQAARLAVMRERQAKFIAERKAKEEEKEDANKHEKIGNTLKDFDRATEPEVKENEKGRTMTEIGTTGSRKFQNASKNLANGMNTNDVKDNHNASDKKAENVSNKTDSRALPTVDGQKSEETVHVPTAIPSSKNHRAIINRTPLVSKQWVQETTKTPTITTTETPVKKKQLNEMDNIREDIKDAEGEKILKNPEKDDNKMIEKTPRIADISTKRPMSMKEFHWQRHFFTLQRKDNEEEKLMKTTIVGREIDEQKTLQPNDWSGALKDSIWGDIGGKYIDQYHETRDEQDKEREGLHNESATIKGQRSPNTPSIPATDGSGAIKDSIWGDIGGKYIDQYHETRDEENREMKGLHEDKATIKGQRSPNTPSTPATDGSDAIKDSNREYRPGKEGLDNSFPN